VCFLDPTLAGERQQTFLADVEGCDLITIDAWRGRGLWSRVQETAASVMQEQA